MTFHEQMQMTEDEARLSRTRHYWTIQRLYGLFLAEAMELDPVWDIKMASTYGEGD